MIKKRLSIKQIFSQVNKLMLILAVIPLLISVLLYSRQILAYQATFKNIQSANDVAAKVDTVVLEELWDVVTGQISLPKYSNQSIVSEITSDIHAIQENTSTLEERSTLVVALRVIDTLENYQNDILKNISLEESYEKNVDIMNDVEGVTQLLSDILQEFVRIEINSASKKNIQLIRYLTMLTIIEFFILISIFYLIKKNDKFLNQRIESPLNNLNKMANELAQGHLAYRLELPETVELAYLTESFNKMADDLTEVLEENALKQYHLAQSEARVLQAQITPHFIYNSLDAIVTLIEGSRYDEAKEMTFALSDFFRISLSKGKDWVSIATEMRHINDYLIILKIRYGEMLNFDITIPETIKEYQILKMILQPLVENAVYHGTKFVRRVGLVEINVKESTSDIIFTIKDNGIGMTNTRLKEVQEELEKGIESTFSTGYGLYNVNKRLLLYYGSNAHIKIESKYQHGTTITLTVPKKEEEITRV